MNTLGQRPGCSIVGSEEHAIPKEGLFRGTAELRRF